MPLFTPELEFSDDYPTIEPSLKLDFANARALDPRITFTRASTATYVGRDGLIKTASEDEARFDHDPATGESLGLLIEESRTNFIPYSNTSEYTVTRGSRGSSQSKKNVDGYLYSDSTGNPNIFYQYSTSTLGNYTFSFFVETPAHTNLILITMGSGGNANFGASISFNFSSNTWNSPSINSSYADSCTGISEYFGDNIWRLSVTINYTALSSNTVMPIIYYQTDASDQWIGGTQLERASFATSYIPTSGSTATREKDLPTIETSSIDFHDFSQGGEGTLLCEFRNDDSNGSDIAVSFSGDTHNGTTFVGLGSNTNNDPFVRNRVNTSNTVLISDSSATTTGYHLVAFGIGQSRSTIAVRNSTNGVQEDTSVSYDTTPYTKIIIGCDQIFTDNNTISGTIKKLFYYPTLLSDTQLQTLTQ